MPSNHVLRVDRKFGGAREFYMVVIVSTALGVAMDFLKINPLKALFWTAVINGLLAPFLLIGILYVASDRKLMLDQPSSMLSRVLVAITTLAMLADAIGMFVL
jgi:Mn2+/Fe2+ NRAMP family transporter